MAHVHESKLRGLGIPALKMEPPKRNQADGKAATTLIAGLRLCILLGCLLGSGCAVTRLVNVKSVPTGAEVFIDAKPLGKTPLVLDTNRLFPNRYWDGQLDAKGFLVFRMAGYRDYLVPVSEFSVPAEISVILEPRSDKK